MFTFKLFTFSKKETVKSFTVPEYIVLNVDNFNSWFNVPNKDEQIYAHPGIFLRLDKLSLSHVINYIHCCYGIDPKKSSMDYDLYKFLEDIKKDWRKRIDNTQTICGNIPNGWIMYEAGQSPLHMQWFVNLVNLNDLCDKVEKPRQSLVEDKETFEEALIEAIKNCK